jgi:hypothetical protein
MNMFKLLRRMCSIGTNLLTPCSRFLLENLIVAHSLNLFSTFIEKKILYFIVTRRLKVGMVEPEKTSIARQWLDNHVSAATYINKD